MKKKSVFQYEIIGVPESTREIARKISAELNRGLTFIVSQVGEKVVSVSGESSGWARTVIRDDNIYVYVDDDFFLRHCIFEQVLTSLWANLLDFGQMRLRGFRLSDNIHTLLTSQDFSKLSVNELVRADGPYFGTVFKPSFGLSLYKKTDMARKFASLGGVFIKEDETYLTNRRKLLKESKAVQRAMNAISDSCFYVPNATPHLRDIGVLRELSESGIRVVMVNYLIAGLPSVYKAIRENNDLLFWGHRVGYRAIEKWISMKAIAVLAAYSGMNMIHIGTPFFSVKNSIRKSLSIFQAVKEINAKAVPVFTKTSQEILSDLIRLFSRNIIIMACGSLRTNGYLDWDKVRQWIKTIKN